MIYFDCFVFTKNDFLVLNFVHLIASLFCREPCSSCAALFSAVEWPYSSAETSLAENN